MAFFRTERFLADKEIFLCILGISWFWLVGATILSQVAPFVKLFLHAQAEVVTLLLTMFSIGIGIGSLLSNRLLRGRIQMTYVPIAALAITLFGIDLFFVTHHAVGGTGTLLTIGQFLRTVTCWRVMFDFLMMAVAGGLYIVPLYAQVQHQGAPSHLARLIAAANIMSALFMVASAVGTVLLLAMRFSIPEIFLTVSLANLLVSIYICRLLPDALIRSILCTVLTFLFRVEAVTLMEIELGILLIERRDATQGARLRVWMNDYILPEFADRTLPVDTAVALRCAGLHVPDPFSERDAFIAATALVHGMTLVTRDLADFKAAAVPLFNPWNAAQ